MKDTTYTKSLTYVGAGAGVVLFAIFGLLPGSFLGGVMGLNLAGSLLGTPVVSGILARLIDDTIGCEPGRHYSDYLGTDRIAWTDLTVCWEGSRNNFV